MRPSRKDKGTGPICISVGGPTGREALQNLREANRLADLIELRLDCVTRPRLETLLQAARRPVIVTNRRKEEGGRYRGQEEARLALLAEAAALGASYVDVEARSSPSLLAGLLGNRKKTRVILSYHDFGKTPSAGELRRLFGRMARQGGDLVKLVTYARAFEDNLKVLSLLPLAREKKVGITAFCMGEKGRISRIFAPLLGAAWTYASLDASRSSAPGQMTVSEIREIWRRLT